MSLIRKQVNTPENERFPSSMDNVGHAPDLDQELG